jgi:hypothetical protein
MPRARTGAAGRFARLTPPDFELHLTYSKGAFAMNKAIRTLILAATILAGFAANSYATGLCPAPAPVPPGVSRG